MFVVPPAKRQLTFLPLGGRRGERDLLKIRLYLVSFAFLIVCTNESYFQS